jgi:hypothetical protein
MCRCDVTTSADVYACKQACLRNGRKMSHVYPPHYLVRDVLRCRRMDIGTQCSELSLGPYAFDDEP